MHIFQIRELGGGGGSIRFNNETIMKSLVICATQLAGGLLLKMVKYFKVMLEIFEFSRLKEIVES